VDLTEQQLDFLQKATGAAMITLRSDGTPASVRVGLAVVDGKLWSSGTQDRVRTRMLRRDPRSTLYVYESPGYRYLSIEAQVRILEGPDAPEKSVRLFRVMQRKPAGPLAWFGRELSEEEFVRTMVDEKRLIYEFEPRRVVGL
jgi:PPOX class probable F420-dependent enzyme